MTAPRLEVIGEERVTAALSQLERDTSSVALPSQRLGDLGIEAARARVPVLTGALSAGIEERVDEHGVSLANSIEYGPAQEFGTRYVTGQRFMRAGFEAMSTAAEPTYAAWLNDRIAATGGTP